MNSSLNRLILIMFGFTGISLRYPRRVFISLKFDIEFIEINLLFRC